MAFNSHPSVINHILDAHGPLTLTGYPDTTKREIKSGSN